MTQDDSNPHHEAHFSPFVCACFTVNYIVGTGFLTLPWAFNKSGILLSAIAMMTICVVSNIASDYLLSAMARAQCMVTYWEKIQEDREDMVKLDQKTEVTKETVEDEEKQHDDTVPLTGGQNDSSKPNSARKMYGTTAFSMDAGSIAESYHHSADKIKVQDQKFEVTELCQIFLGDWGFKAYAFCIILYCYGTLWAYASVFGNAMAQSIPLGAHTDSYMYYIIFFGLVVGPMSFLELSEQVAIQVFLSGCRFLMLFLMIVTPLVAMYASHHDQDSVVDHFDNQTASMGAPLVHFKGIPQMFPIVVFSTIFHQGIGGLAEEVKDKSQLGNIFGLTFVIVGSAYTLIGIIDAWYFGNAIRPSSNLNWENYHGFNGGWIASFIAFFTVCFPAIDVISAYPLNAVVLTNSLMGMYFGDKVHEVEHDRHTRSFFIISSCVPPIFGALIERNLGTITDYTGVTGLGIAFLFPGLLYFFSERRMRELGLPTETHYQRFGSSMKCAIGVVIFGLVSIVYVLFNLILHDEV